MDLIGFTASSVVLALVAAVSFGAITYLGNRLCNTPYELGFVKGQLMVAQKQLQDNKAQSEK